MEQGWKDAYAKKLTTADVAAKVVKSGDWVEYAFGLCGSEAFDQALAKRKDELSDVKIRCDIGAYRHHTLEASSEVFTWNSWHVAGHDKAWLNKGLYYIPMKFHECPVLTRNNCVPTNVFVAQVSSMDKHGYFSWGVGAPSSMAAFETADVCILEVNPKMPRVLGGEQECIHVSQVDHIIEVDNDLPTIPDNPPNEVETRIAQQIIPRLRDGCCIQLGIGGVPNAVGGLIAASDLKDLGVHTEMYVDAYVKMTEAGKITGKYKNFDRYKQVFSFAMGTQKLYDFIDDNPGCVAYSVDYVNTPSRIARLDNFVSINACVELDLFGQVCSESIGTRHISGTGGQLDFVEGAYKSKGGQSFICTPSTKEIKGKTVSTIKPTLTTGAIVTSPRTATHMIVTENGIADLKGKSTWERAEALIAVAHPDFQEQLVKEAEAMNIWRKSNK
ncbi:MAG: butyryl-CoA:acetate CoA-transferase [Gammaproteobacteria bacterium]|nr:MAG: butyryl-CoA:acetate CoA-transferase [Pseudomonadota bacterium]PIE38885.1 MAG: butyryl-CoA:acetate CoA-transferase [Gammaproteobacteria bacterium]